MLAAFNASSECHMKVQKKPQAVFTAKVFSKVGGLELVGLTTSLSVVKSGCTAPKSVPRDGCIAFDHDGVANRVYARPSLQFPKTVAVKDTKVAAWAPFIVSFWAVQPTPSEAKANMEYASREVVVRVQGEPPRVVQVPVMRNTRPVAEGEELRVLALLDDDVQPAPPAKKARMDEPSKPAAKGKAKAKGKGKGTR